MEQMTYRCDRCGAMGMGQLATTYRESWVPPTGWYHYEFNIEGGPRHPNDEHKGVLCNGAQCGPALMAEARRRVPPAPPPLPDEEQEVA